VFEGKSYRLPAIRRPLSCRGQRDQLSAGTDGVRAPYWFERDLEGRAPQRGRVTPGEKAEGTAGSM